MGPIVAKFLKLHEAADNSNDYVPTWTHTNPSGKVVTDDGMGNLVPGSVGYYSPNWYGIHNFSVDQDVTIWTVAQGTVTGPSSTPLPGVTVHIKQGDTFYAHIAKITVTNPVVLLGTDKIQGTL